MASTDSNINLTKYDYYLDPFFIATEGIGAIGFDHIISPLSVASLGYLALELVRVFTGGGDGEMSPLPDEWKWKPLQDSYVDKSVGEIKDILKNQLGEESHQEIEEIETIDNINSVTKKITDPTSIAAVRALIKDILKDDNVTTIKLDFRLLSDQHMKKSQLKVISELVQKNITADLIREQTTRIRTKNISTTNIKINNIPKIKISVQNKK